MPDTTTRAQETPEGVKRWRRIPAEPEVQAVQLLDADDLDWYAIAAWCGGEVGVQAVGDSGEFDSYIEIPGQERCAFEGAWIVRSAAGFRVIEDFVFAETYEAAAGGPQTAPHAHEFPCQPPDGDLLAPGDCLVCGKPYALDVAQKRAAEAGMVLVDPDQADEAARLKAELSRVQSAAQTLGKIVTRHAQSMEAARIEMFQNGPEAAMQWILNSLPDVSDEAPEDQWDGKETATQWIDRTQAADRAADAAEPQYAAEAPRVLVDPEDLRTLLKVNHRFAYEAEIDARDRLAAAVGVER
jgi:hypothetical protein